MKKRAEIAEGDSRLVRVADAVRREQLEASREAIRSLWRVGDWVRELRDLTSRRAWRRTLQWCAQRAGVHPSSMDAAIRAAVAFPPEERDALLARLEQAGALISPSHVIELSYANGARRAAAVERLLIEPQAVRALRASLRGERACR